MHSWFVALSHSALGHAMQTSKWGFALVETLHLLALATLGGSVLILDLRLLGIVLRKESARIISRDLGRILLGSLLAMILSGVALLSEEALKCYYSPAFRWKMALLAAALGLVFSAYSTYDYAEHLDRQVHAVPVYARQNECAGHRGRPARLAGPCSRHR